jgi:hypothetical protein
MRFWIRELAGWILMALGLYVLFIALVFLVNVPPRFIEAGPLTLIGIIVFRGGVHLLKVAVAARICLQAQESLKRESARKLRHSEPGMSRT